MIVHKICNISGLMYSLEHGANVGIADETVWKDFFKVCAMTQKLLVIDRY